MKTKTVKDIVLIVVMTIAIITMLYVHIGDSASAQEWNDVDGCVRYKADPKLNAIIIQTTVDLTLEKQVLAATKFEVENKCNEVGKSLHGQLWKIPEVRGAHVATREIAVLVYSYPEGLLEDILPKIEETAVNVLCGD